MGCDWGELSLLVNRLVHRLLGPEPAGVSHGWGGTNPRADWGFMARVLLRPNDTVHLPRRLVRR